MLEPGKYAARLRDAELQELGRDRHPVLKLFFQVSHRWNEDNAWEQLPQDEEAEVLFFLVGKSEERSIRGLKSLGFNGDFAEPRFNEDLYKRGTVLRAYRNRRGYINFTVDSLDGERGSKPADDATIRYLNDKFKNAEEKPTATNESLPFE